MGEMTWVHSMLACNLQTDLVACCTSPSGPWPKTPMLWRYTLSTEVSWFNILSNIPSLPGQMWFPLFPLFFLLYRWVCIKLYWCCGTVLYYYMLVGTKNALEVLVEKSIPLCVSVRDCLFFYHSAEAHIVRTEQSCLMVSGLCDHNSCDVHIRGML